MEVKNEYGKNRVVVINVGQVDVDGMLINWDLTDSGQYDYMENEFISAVMNYLPEYAMGYDAEKLSPIEIVEYLRESAKSVIKIKKIDEIKHYLDKETPYQNWDPEVFCNRRYRNVCSGDEVYQLTYVVIEEFSSVGTPARH
jgi:hypothetical protein